MGLLTSALLAPLAPVRGVVWLAERLEEQALAELNGPEAVRRQLNDLYDAFDRGDIDAAEFDAEEERLLRALMPPGHGTDSGHGMVVVPTNRDGKWER